MQIGSTPIQISNSPNIPYNVSAYTLQSAFAQFEGFSNVQVVFSGVFEYGGRWIISFYEYFNTVPTITVSGSGLTGGLDGTSPTIAYSNARPYSSHILFDPVT
jgi:hypothetical protein